MKIEFNDNAKYAAFALAGAIAVWAMFSAISGSASYPELRLSKDLSEEAQIEAMQAWSEAVQAIAESQ